MKGTFETWLSISTLSAGGLPKYGYFSAVYVMRDSITKEILKYGSTKCLRQRILGNYLGGVGGGTTQRIHSELFENEMISRVEIAWIETTDEVEAITKERQLREMYKQTHGRRPSWDRRG